MTPSLNGSSTKKTGEERTLASLHLLRKKGWKYRWAFPGDEIIRVFKTFNLLQGQHCRNSPLFRCSPPPDLACELAVAGTPCLMC